MSLILMFIIFLIGCICGARIPVIIDTDIGQDFDDTMAVSYALSRNDVFDIKLILAATKNTTGRASLIAKYLQTVDRTEIDIGVGLNGPCDGEQGCVGPQMPWAENYYLSSYPGTVYLDGIGRAKQILQAASPSNPIYWIEIAPVPNLGVLFSSNPELKSNMRLIAMAGSIYKGYGTNYTQGEYNIGNNLSSSQLVYNYTDKIPFASPICSAPLDTTYFFQIYGPNYQTILNSNQIIPKTLVENYNVWYNNGGKNFGAYRPFSPTTGTSCMYDAQAMFMASMVAQNGNCQTMPYMSLQRLKIVVNDAALTINDTVANNNIQWDYEAIAWNGGEFNGTYPLGEFIANTLANPK